MAVAELAELEALLTTRAPRSPWCTAPSRIACPCYKCSALRIIRYGVRG